MPSLLRAALTAGALALPIPAISQTPERETFGDWVLVCDGGQPCRLVHQQTIRDSGALALRLIAVKVEGGAVVAAQLPMGVHLPSGAVYRLQTPEDEPQRQMIWQRCLDEICEAAIQLTAEDLDLFSKAEALLFAYRMAPQDEPRIMQVNLTGFLDGLERTGP